MALYKGEDKIKDIYLGDVPIFKVYAGEEFCGFFTFSHENLVPNSDLLIDSDSDNTPDGFLYNRDTTDISLTNGIAKFTATAKDGSFCRKNTDTYIIGNKYYHYAKVKASNSYVRLYVLNPSTSCYHSGSGTFEHLSFISELTAIRDNIYIMDSSSSDWTPIEVDYIGAINITDLVSRGILPSGLTNAQYKDILDNYFNS